MSPCISSSTEHHRAPLTWAGVPSSIVIYRGIVPVMDDLYYIFSKVLSDISNPPAGFNSYTNLMRTR